MPSHSANHGSVHARLVHVPALVVLALCPKSVALGLPQKQIVKYVTIAMYWALVTCNISESVTVSACMLQTMLRSSARSEGLSLEQRGLLIIVMVGIGRH